jgi:hypothetical protein
LSFVFDSGEQKISPKPGLNQRPIAYKAIALPLSY